MPGRHELILDLVKDGRLFERVTGPEGSVMMRTDAEHYGQHFKKAKSIVDPQPLQSGDSGNIYTDPTLQE